MKKIKRQLSRFLIVGLIAFVVDGIILLLLVYTLSVSPIYSRIVSCSLALLLAFYLHARFTFESEMSLTKFFRYGVLQAISASLNILVYTIWLGYSYHYGAPLIGLILGSAVATGCNFFGNKFFVYKGSGSDTFSTH